MSTPLSQEIIHAHATAVKRGDGGYIDPESGLFVLTDFQLKMRGYCCGQGCRHCPYSAEEQRKAGRPGVADSASSKEELEP
jgi:hypothetical protein